MSSPPICYCREASDCYCGCQRNGTSLKTHCGPGHILFGSCLAVSRECCLYMRTVLKNVSLYSPAKKQKKIELREGKKSSP